MSKTSTSSAALAASERSGEAANAAGAELPPPRPLVPDSEVVARPHRRRFSPEYKRSILDQADAAKDVGAVGALLRREGLYSSHLGTWRRQRKQGELDAFTPKKRGPKVVVSPLVKQNRDLQANVARLTKKLKNAELIIEVPKKWLRCWATRFRTSRSTKRTDGCRSGVGRKRWSSSRLSCSRCAAGHVVSPYAASRSTAPPLHAGAGFGCG